MKKALLITLLPMLFLGVSNSTQAQSRPGLSLLVKGIQTLIKPLTESHQSIKNLHFEANSVMRYIMNDDKTLRQGAEKAGEWIVNVGKALEELNIEGRIKTLFDLKAKEFLRDYRRFLE